MTFLDELERLKEKATKGKWGFTNKYELGPISKEDDQSFSMIIPIADTFGENKKQDAEFITFLVNHANEIAELVKAAEKVTRHSGSAHRAVEQSGLREALANLNKGKS